MKHSMACGAVVNLLLLFLVCNITNTCHAARSAHLEIMSVDQNLRSRSSSSSSSFDYGDALAKGILFFEGQRSGKLPPTQRAKWRGDSALTDGSLQNVDLTGGYYDAGDNVKFCWPMAFSVTLLSWAAIEHEAQFSSANQLGYLHSAISWGTDFLLKAQTSPTTLYAQVGDNADHNCWERPEDMDTPRTLFKISSESPGTEPAAEFAAAFAAASLVFKNVNAAYSARLLHQSELLFQFADKYRVSYNGSCPFYCSYSGYQDELLWAAAWLYKASGESSYLDYVSNNQFMSQPIPEFSWDNKFAGVQTLLAKEFLLEGKTDLSRYKTDADYFVCATMPGSSSEQIKKTPGGLLFTRDSSNLQYASSAAMVLLYYSNILNSAHVAEVQCGSVSFSPAKIRAFAQSQIDYILGNNPLNMSFMAGFGSKYPTQLHHRGASIPSIHVLPEKVGCNNGWSWYSSPSPNPNVHVGAVVGGPNSNDQFNDLRSEYSHLEPTTYINAAFVGSVAALLGPMKEPCLEMPCQQNGIHSSSYGY